MVLIPALGLAMTAFTLFFAGRRVWWLYRVTMSGQPAPDRVQGVFRRLGVAVRTQLTEVFGQRKLLKWTVPGAAHFFVFWAFMILLTVYIEAYGSLFERGFAIPGIGHSPILGFLQDFIAMMCFLGIVTFAIIRWRNRPAELGRKSRFNGSHLGGAWLTLIMIFNVLWTIFLFRGSSAAAGNLPYGNAAFISHAVGDIIHPFGHGTALVLEQIGLLLHIAVMLVFLMLVLHSKHLHIFIAPINVLFGRRPMALGAIKPMTSGGQPVKFEDLEEMDEDMALGVGRVEDFSWKGILDFNTCTECGRCQSQCPAWNTDKPLSPKMLILMLRDHTTAKAPYLLAGSDEERAKLPASVLAEAERPLVGETEGLAWEPTGGAVIDNDVLWSCTSCGACVNQCPVDIEHVDHIMDMRRHQVLVESNFPSELNGLFRGMESKGNPWNMSATARLEWAQGLDFPVKVVGEDVESLDEVEWLFWVGCAGAYEDRAKKTTRAVAELLNMAGVDFAVLGNGETCTGDPARRAGNEFIFQGLAAQNAETLKEHRAKKVVATCAHCFNTLKNEYDAFGVELDVVHHTQLLNRLVREKKLTPVAVPGSNGGANGAGRSITYHDPCYLGRHNQVYNPPRELLEIIPDATFTEMPRSGERSFCCGAGGARMWMEETIGERINVNRTREAVATGADQIAVACPFCRVMLADGLTAEQQDGNAREEVEVLDVAQLLLASVKGEAPVKAKAPAGITAGTTTATTAGGGTSGAVATAVETKDEPETGDVTQTSSTVTETSDVGPNAKASGGSSSLFDDPSSLFGEEPQASSPTPNAEHAGPPEEKSGSLFAEGGSLFDTPAQAAVPETEEASASASEAKGGGGSLFDIGAPAEPEPAPAAEKASEPTQPPAEAEDEHPETSSASVPEGGSLFDIKEAVKSKSDDGAPTGAGPAAGAATADTEDPAPAEQPAPATETASEDEKVTKPGPSGEAHQPKTDADISETGSLFDL